MPDCKCTNCGEPWDWFYLRDELIHETSEDYLVKSQKDNFIEYGVLSNATRFAFKAIGWKFGGTLAHIVRCECCPKGEEKVTMRGMLADAMEDILGDDIDGFISEMEDAEYLFGTELDK